MRQSQIDSSMKARFALFRSYYEHIFSARDIALPDIKFRHFRFQLFSKGTLFRRVKDILETPASLYDLIVRLVPRNAYYTPVKWLNPIYVGKTKEELDVMLSAPLYFDIDMHKLENPIFSEAKRTAEDLIAFIRGTYGRDPDQIVFSGSQGFHVYYWDWDKDRILKLSPADRVTSFRKSRKRILMELSERRIRVDNQITFDPFRIMKIPNTLHGNTGLIAKPVTDVNAFDPQKDARAFNENVYEEIFQLDLEHTYIQ